MSISSSDRLILKSKTGCQTCRKRRIKCDEALPACYKCQTNGRRCPGYATRFTQVTVENILSNKTRPQSKIPLVRQPSQQMSAATQHDGQAYDFYRCAAASHVVDYLDHDLWYKTILQYSQIDLAIHHAVTAIGHLSRHSATCLAVGLAPCTCAAYRSGVEKYSKSIVQLQKRTSGSDTWVPQAACALFTCIEALLGNSAQVIRLVDVAIPMHQDGAHDESAPFLEFFHRLRIYFYLLQQDYRPSDARTLSTGPPDLGFGGLHDARRSLYAMIRDVILFVNLPAWRQGSNDQAVHIDDLGTFTQQRDLLIRLRKWHEASETLSVQAGATEAFAIMGAHVILAELWVEVVTMRDECAFENAELAFTSILQRASKHVSQRQNSYPGNPVLFNFELSWLTPLYYTALKCRHIKLRKQALSLLKCLPKQDGIWQGNRLASLAEQVVGREMEHGRLFQEVVAGPASMKNGRITFKADYRLAESDDTVLAQTFSEVLTIAV